ncbi:hypothetical protein D3C81_2057150 [compost metagenome]
MASAAGAGAATVASTADSAVISGCTTARISGSLSAGVSIDLATTDGTGFGAARAARMASMSAGSRRSTTTWWLPLPRKPSFSAAV